MKCRCENASRFKPCLARAENSPSESNLLIFKQTNSKRKRIKSTHHSFIENWERRKWMKYIKENVKLLFLMDIFDGSQNGALLTLEVRIGAVI